MVTTSWLEWTVLLVSTVAAATGIYNVRQSALARVRAREERQNERAFRYERELADVRHECAAAQRLVETCYRSRTGLLSIPGQSDSEAALVYKDTSERRRQRLADLAAKLYQLPPNDKMMTRRVIEFSSLRAELRILMSDLDAERAHDDILRQRQEREYQRLLDLNLHAAPANSSPNARRA